VSPIIRSVHDTDVEALAELTLLAFAPVFDSFQEILGPVVYRMIWPEWKQSQKKAIEDLCSGVTPSTVLVAEVDGAPVGYIAYGIRPGGSEGEVLLLAVHPERQNSGIGSLLNERALEGMKDAGVSLAIAETGGDASHAPARRSYEKAGYVGLPRVRYFKDL